jgi:hypothetical protein
MSNRGINYNDTNYTRCKKWNRIYNYEYDCPPYIECGFCGKDAYLHGVHSDNGIYDCDHCDDLLSLVYYCIYCRQRKNVFSQKY